MRIGIGFDIDHTLLIDNKLERIAFMRLLESVIEDGGHAVGTLAEEQERIDALLNRQRHASRSIEETIREFMNTHGVALTTAAAHASEGVSPKRRYVEHRYVERYKKIALGLVDQVVIPMPGVRETLAELRARDIALAILTNGWNPLQERKARCVGFDSPLIVSGDIGIQKPDPRAFDALLEILDVPRELAWYVGDDPACDIAGARNAGFNAIWLDAEGKAYPPKLPPPTRTVHSLNEILTLFS